MESQEGTSSGTTSTTSSIVDPAGVDQARALYDFLLNELSDIDYGYKSLFEVLSDANDVKDEGGTEDEEHLVAALNQLPPILVELRKWHDHVYDTQPQLESIDQMLRSTRRQLQLIHEQIGGSRGTDTAEYLDSVYFIENGLSPNDGTNIAMLVTAFNTFMDTPLKKFLEVIPQVSAVVDPDIHLQEPATLPILPPWIQLASSLTAERLTAAANTNGEGKWFILSAPSGNIARILVVAAENDLPLLQNYMSSQDICGDFRTAYDQNNTLIVAVMNCPNSEQAWIWQEFGKHGSVVFQ